MSGSIVLSLAAWRQLQGDAPAAALWLGFEAAKEAHGADAWMPVYEFATLVGVEPAAQVARAVDVAVIHRGVVQVFPQVVPG